MIKIEIPYQQICNKEHFDNASIDDEIEYICPGCNKQHTTTKRGFVSSLRIRLRKGVNYKPLRCCTSQCSRKFFYPTDYNTKPCGACGKPVKRRANENKYNKSENLFCNHSCAATYHNQHKTYGYNRSKLEVYLEGKLLVLYPNIEFHFNRRDTINSELDIYIPIFKLGFELNGIFHYEPIFSYERLERSQNNDSRKFQACLEKGIELCMIDCSSMKCFKEVRAEPYLKIITDIIDSKINSRKHFTQSSQDEARTHNSEIQILV